VVVPYFRVVVVAKSLPEIPRVVVVPVAAADNAAFGESASQHSQLICQLLGADSSSFRSAAEVSRPFNLLVRGFYMP